MAPAEQAVSRREIGARFGRSIGSESPLSVSITHSDALRLSRHVGRLVAEVYGTPDVVVGIERSGRPLARAFAAGCGAREQVNVCEQRPSSTGVRGHLRRQVRRSIPRLLRRAYKRVFFKSAVHLDRLAQRTTRPIRAESLDAIHRVVAADRSQFVVVVDDAIDSGATMRSVIDAIESRSRSSTILPFCLTSTAGVRCAENQLTVFQDIVEFIEGDLAELGETRTNELLAALTTESDSADRPSAARTSSDPIRLYLDLDGTLVANSFRDAMHALEKVMRPREIRRYVGSRLMRKTLARSHSQLARRIDDLILGLDDERRSTFEDELVKRLHRSSRGPLVAIAKAPGVRARIVTAALASYAGAVERAFGIPVLCASGRSADGSDWHEIQSHEKVAAIVEDRHRAPSPHHALLLGDTATDALSAFDGLDVKMIPDWDETGLVTLLGAASWWTRGAGTEAEVRKHWPSKSRR